MNYNLVDLDKESSELLFDSYQKGLNSNNIEGVLDGKIIKDGEYLLVEGENGEIVGYASHYIKGHLLDK
jgi:hypothetical protein